MLRGANSPPSDRDSALSPQLIGILPVADRRVTIEAARITPTHIHKGTKVMPSKGLQKISRRLISEDVLCTLRIAILEGAFEIGEHLVETEIADQLGTSRVPVREAFKELAREKLIELHPFKGAAVASFTATDIHEIYELRSLLEGHAARLVAEQATPDELGHLQELHEEIETLIVEDDWRPILQKDFAFHRQLCRVSGNGRLLEIWDTLASQVRLVMTLADQILLEPSFILEVHRPVIKALINRDPGGAEEAMVLHLRKTADLLAQGLESRDAANREKATRDWTGITKQESPLPSP